MGETADMDSFDMASLRSNLPHSSKRRGLSKCYSGKSQSFASMADIRSVEDLKKKRKKFSDWQGGGTPSKSSSPVPSSPCRRVSSSSQCSTMPYIDV